MANNSQLKSDRSMKLELRNTGTSRPPWLVEYLIAPELRDGRDPQAPPAPVEEDWLELEERIAIWVKRGSLPEELGKLLEAAPRALKDPLVQRQLWHLRALVSGLIPLSDYGVHELIREAATTDLKTVLSGFVIGMLPDWQATFRPILRRGRRRMVDPRDLLSCYKELLSGLKYRIAKDRFLLVRRGGEDVVGFVQRSASLAADLYRNSSLSLEVSPGNGEGPEDWSWRREQLPGDQANRIAARAVKKSGRRASPKALVYGLLSYHYGKRPAELEKLIDRAEANDPYFASKIRWYKDQIPGRRR